MEPETNVKVAGRLRWFVAPLISMLLLGGIYIEWVTGHLPATDAAPYHQAIREEAAKIPLNIEGWIGTEQELPRPAIALLKPNVALSRRYLHVATGNSMSLLFIQCKEARDLYGHHPPSCYPSNGWTAESVEPRDWKIGDLQIPGTEYTFTRSRLDGDARLIVYHFVIRPDGLIERDTEGLRRASADLRKRGFGGAQVQLVFMDTIPETERKAAFQALIPLVLPVIEMVRTKVSR